MHINAGTQASLPVFCPRGLVNIGRFPAGWMPAAPEKKPASRQAGPPANQTFTHRRLSR